MATPDGPTPAVGIPIQSILEYFADEIKAAWPEYEYAEIKVEDVALHEGVIVLVLAPAPEAEVV